MEILKSGEALEVYLWKITR